MAVPNCATLTIGSQGIQIRMPGGAKVAVSSNLTNPTNLQLSKSLLGQANAALAPLAPVFTIIDALLSIQGAIEAVPESLGPPPDPTAMASALADMAQKMAKIAELIPQLSIPFMILDIVDMVIISLDGVVTELQAIVDQQARISAAASVASQPGNGALSQIVVCAEDINVKTQSAIVGGLGPISQILGVLGLFLGLVPGAPSIPDLGSIDGDASVAIGQLNDFVQVLKTVRNSIPVP